MKTLTSTLAAMALWAGSPLADASVIVTASQDAPTANIVYEIIGNSTSGVIFQNATRPTWPTGKLYRSQGQVFSVEEDARLQTVVFRLPPSLGTIHPAVYGAELELTFYSVSRDQPGDPLVPLAEIRRYSFVMPDAVQVNDYLYFNLEDAFEASGGTFYGVELSFKDTGANRNLNILHTGTAAPGVNRFSYLDTMSGDDHVSEWQVSSGALHLQLIAIPEPGGVALLLGAGLPLAWIARKTVLASK